MPRRLSFYLILSVLVFSFVTGCALATRGAHPSAVLDDLETAGDVLKTTQDLAVEYDQTGAIPEDAWNKYVAPASLYANTSLHAAHTALKAWTSINDLIAQKRQTEMALREQQSDKDLAVLQAEIVSLEAQAVSSREEVLKRSTEAHDAVFAFRDAVDKYKKN